MVQTVISLLPAIAVGAVALIWGTIAILAWSPAAKRRGGAWYLEALFLIMGPVTTTIVFFYPGEPGADPGVLGSLNRAVTATGVVLAAIAIIGSLSRPRRNVGVLVAAIALYYLALALSTFAGAVAQFPEAFWITPILVLAFTLHDFDRAWLLWASRWTLRSIVLLSLAAAVAFPASAFNTDEARTLFGLDRLAGIVGHPNGLAIVAVVGLILEVSRERKDRLWIAAMFLTVALAQSLTGWVALLVAALVMASRLSRILRVTGAVALVGIAIATVVMPPDRGPLSVISQNNLTLNGRTRIWDTALWAYSEYPVFGWGPTVLGDDFRDRFLLADGAGQAHNQFIQSMAESGTVGLLALIIFLAVIGWRAWKSRTLDAGLALALFAVLLAQCVTETPFRPSGVGIASLLLVIVVTLVAAVHNERAEGEIAPGATDSGTNAPVHDRPTGRSGPRAS